jgi:hypothetical protein
MQYFEMDAKEVERLFEVIRKFPDTAEKSINEVFRNEAPEMVEESIRLLMPMSGKTWKGKAPPARTAKSLEKSFGNLSFMVKTKGKYGYLYFPDDGSNSRRHVGNQQFFKRGGEMEQRRIVDLCVNRLIDGFNG